MKYIQLVTCILLLISSFLVGYFQNPVNSVIFLIYSFFNASLILFMFHIEFFALTFLIIYVGAIAVLFLFVVMMLNIKKSNESSKSFFLEDLINNPLFFSLLVFSCFQYGVIYFHHFFDNKIPNTFTLSPSTYFTMFTDEILQIEVLGRVFYDNYLYQLLIIGIILMIALIGAIVITLNAQTKKETYQIVNRQLSRNTLSISYFK